jgi:hypothetical protein
MKISYHSLSKKISQENCIKYWYEYSSNHYYIYNSFMFTKFSNPVSCKMFYLLILCILWKLVIILCLKKYLRKIASNIDMNIVHAYPIQNEEFLLRFSHLTNYLDRSFRDIRGHLGKIPSIVTFYISALVVEGDYSRITRRNPEEYK